MTSIVCSLASAAVAVASVFTLGGCASNDPPSSSSATYSTPEQFPGASWTRDDPAALGWSAERLAAAVEYAKREGSTAGMVVQHGLVIAQWGDTSRKSELYSARKSFMSALVGIAVEKGEIHLDETLAELGIDDKEPSLTPTEKQATVRELLEARSGVYHPTVYETASMEQAKPPRGSHGPGEFWYYNNWDFNSIGAIYEKATGQRIFDALETQIAIPIGMQDYRPSDGYYVSGGRATQYPAYPIRMSARDLARFALLFLHNGRWRDQQIVPSSWVTASTHSYSDTPTGGYGYMWWTSTPANGPRGPAATLLRETFWADGHLGQYAVVVPSLDLVVVTRVDAKLTKKQMGQQKMEKLVLLVEAAEGAADIGAEAGVVRLAPLPT